MSGLILRKGVNVGANVIAFWWKMRSLGAQVVLMDENVTRLREEWYLWEQMACIWDRNGL